jgi:hypothetical protein
MKVMILASVAGMVCLAGCTAHTTATNPIKPTQAQVDASIAATQQRIKEVQNDPSIPDSVKGQIVGRLQGNMDRTRQANKPTQ